MDLHEMYEYYEKELQDKKTAVPEQKDEFLRELEIAIAIENLSNKRKAAMK